MPDISVKIDGTERSARTGTLSLVATLGQRAAFNVTIISEDGSYRPEVGDDLELWETGVKLWAGSVDEVEEVSISEGNPDGAFYHIRGVSWEQRLDRRYCYDIDTAVPAIYERNYIFTADDSTDTLTTEENHGRSNGDRVKVKAHAQGTLCSGLDASIEYYVVNATSTTLQLSLTAGGGAVDITDTGTLEQILITNRAGEIVSDLCDTFAGLESIGTTNIDLGAVVDTVYFEAQTTVSSAVAQMAILSGYVWWIDEEREMYFKPRSYATAPFSVSESSGNSRNFSVRRTREDKCNTALMAVDWSQIEIAEETFAGDGSSRTFTLPARPGQLVKIIVNGEDKEFGTWLADADRAYYWSLGSTTIRQDEDETILTADDGLVVQYRVLGRNVILEEDASDVSTTATQEGSGSGRYMRYFERPGASQTQASSDGQAIIAQTKDVVSEIGYETNQYIEPLCVTLRPGQLQTIANAPRGVSSGSYLIREVNITDMGGRWLRIGVKAISGTFLTGAIEFWKAMTGGGAAASVAVAGGNSGAIGNGSTALEITLSANTTIASPYTPTTGDMLFIRVIQGSGPYTISFDSEFEQSVNTNISPIEGESSYYIFRGMSDNLWHAFASPYQPS